jgi:hypothetical protein
LVSKVIKGRKGTNKMQDFRTNTERDMDVLALPLPGEGEEPQTGLEKEAAQAENEARWEHERDRVDMLLASALMPVLPDGGSEKPF